MVPSRTALRSAQCWRRSQALLIIALVNVSTCAARRSLQHVHLQSSANRAVGIGCCTASGPQGLELVVRGFARALLAMRLQLRVRRSRLGKSGACASVLQAASCSSQSRRFLSPFPSRAPNFDKATDEALCTHLWPATAEAAAALRRYSRRSHKATKAGLSKIPREVRPGAFEIWPNSRPHLVKTALRSLNPPPPCS